MENQPKRHRVENNDYQSDDDQPIVIPVRSIDKNWEDMVDARLFSIDQQIGAIYDVLKSMQNDIYTPSGVS